MNAKTIIYAVEQAVISELDRERVDGAMLSDVLNFSRDLLDEEANIRLLCDQLTELVDKYLDSGSWGSLLRIADAGNWDLAAQEVRRFLLGWDPQEPSVAEHLVDARVLAGYEKPKFLPV